MADQLWQRHPTPSLPHGCRARAIDATTVSRPGSLGTDWRLHFSVNLEDLQCDFVQVTDVGGGETFRRIPVAPGDVLLGDRCYGTPPGIAHVARAGGHVLVRVNHRTLPLWDIEGRPFRLAAELRATIVGQIREWPTVVRHDGSDYPGRLVAVKRDRWAACLERRALRKRASKKQKQLSQTALFLAGYFFVWTDVSAEALDAAAVLAWYRCRWQIEMSHPDYPSSEGLYRRDRAA